MQRFSVTGMTCGHCIRAITQAIGRLDAAATVRVDLDRGLVETDSKLESATLAAALTEEGYGVASLPA